MNVKVTVSLTAAYELWDMEVPNSIPDDEVEDYVMENFHTSSDKSLADTGADLYEITEVDWVKEEPVDDN